MTQYSLKNDTPANKTPEMEEAYLLANYATEITRGMGMLLNDLARSRHEDTQNRRYAEVK